MKTILGLKKLSRLAAAAVLLAGLGVSAFAQTKEPVGGVPDLPKADAPKSGALPSEKAKLPPVGPADHVKKAQALQDYGLPPLIYLQDPAKLEEAQAMCPIYSVTLATPSAIGAVLLETLDAMPAEKVGKITYKKLYMALYAILQYASRAADPKYQAHPELLASYKAKIKDVMDKEIPNDTDYAGLGKGGKSLRDVLNAKQAALRVVIDALEKLPPEKQAAVADKKAFVQRMIDEMDALRLTPNGQVLVPDTLPELVRLIPEKDLAAAQWKAIFEAYPMGKSLWADRMDRVWRSSVDGKGITVAILDTGIDKAHPFTGGAVTDFGNFTGHRYVGHDQTDAAGNDLFGKPDNRGGHGTHMAGVFHAYAPQAKIMNIKVLDEEAREEIPPELRHDLPQTIASITAGLQQVYDHNAAIAAGTKKGGKIDIVSMSLGMPESNTGALEAQRDAISAMVKKLSAQGVIVVVAAGNEGKTQLARPGYAPEAITVGAADYFDRVAAFSSDGSVVVPGETRIMEKPDVYGYGVGVRSAKYDPAGDYSSKLTDQLTAAANGTSPATPHVAAVAALLLQSGRQMGVELTSEQIRTILKESSTPLANGNPYAGSMGGVVNADKALEYLQKNLKRFKKKN